MTESRSPLILSLSALVSAAAVVAATQVVDSDRGQAAASVPNLPSIATVQLLSYSETDGTEDSSPVDYQLFDYIDPGEKVDVAVDPVVDFLPVDFLPMEFDTAEFDTAEFDTTEFDFPPNVYLPPEFETAESDTQESDIEESGSTEDGSSPRNGGGVILPYYRGGSIDGIGDGDGIGEDQVTPYATGSGSLGDFHNALGMPPDYMIEAGNPGDGNSRGGIASLVANYLAAHESQVLAFTATIPQFKLGPVTVGRGVVANAYFNGYDGSQTGVRGVATYVKSQLTPQTPSWVTCSSCLSGTYYVPPVAAKLARSAKAAPAASHRAAPRAAAKANAAAATSKAGGRSTSR